MQPMSASSRRARTARGTVGAVATTLFAAASHAIAGGTVTGASVLAATLVALPICVMLAGRAGSLWRMSVAVFSAQFLYHWTFAGIGVAGTTGLAEVASPHAAHLAQLESFVPSLAAAGAADATMWIGHACAALLTIALLHRGERAALALLRLVRRLVRRAVMVPLELSPASHAPGFSTAPLIRERLVTLSSITHRGPPTAGARH